jgi:type IV secretory pathway VirB2 component (pilin)
MKRFLSRTRHGAVITLSTIFSFLHSAHASVTGGGAMPYSTGLTTFSTSLRGEIAGILIVIGVIGGVGLWIAGGQLEGMLQTIARVIIGACIVGGVVTFMTTIGVAGAVI